MNLEKNKKCQSITRSGTQCQRKPFLGGRYCWQHESKLTKLIKSISIFGFVTALATLIGLIVDTVDLFNMLVGTPSVTVSDTPELIVSKSPSQTVFVVPTETLMPEVTKTQESNILFEANFEDGQIPHLYIKGRWQIVDDEGNNVFEFDNRNGSNYSGFDFGSIAWKDYSISYRVRMLNLIEYAPEVISEFRKNSDGSNRYIQAFTPYYDSLSLNIALNSSAWEPITSQVYNFIEDEWYTVRIYVFGSNIKVTLNGVQYFNIIDDRVGSGMLNLSVGPGSHVQFDDIVVESLQK